MKKRFLAAVLAAVMALSLAACGEKNTESDSTKTVSESKEPAKQEASDKEENEPEKEVSDDKVMAYIMPWQSMEVFEPNVYARVGYDAIHLNQPEKYPELTQALEEYSTTTAQEHDDQFEAFKAEIESMLGDNGAYIGSETLDTTISVVRNSGNIFSFWENSYLYMGGAHGMPAVTGVNYEISTGKKILWEDVVKSNEVLTDALVEELMNDERGPWDDIDADYLFVEDESITDKADKVRAIFYKCMDGTYSDLSFAINYDSVDFYIAPYILGPYAMGSVKISIPMGEYPEAINAEYATKATSPDLLPRTDTTITKIEGVRSENGYTYGNPYSEGELWAIGEYDDADYLNLTVGYGDEIIYKEEQGSCFDAEVYEAHDENGTYAFVSKHVENDYEYILTIDMRGVAVSTGYGFMGNEPTSMNSLKVGSRAYSISTFAYIADAVFCDNRFSIYGEGYEILGDWQMKALKDIIAYEDCDAMDSQIKIKKGTKFTPILEGRPGTNAVKVRTEKGVEGWIFYSRDPETFERTINGNSIYEMIDGVVFAG